MHGLAPAWARSFAQAQKERGSPSNSRLMIHQPTGGAGDRRRMSRYMLRRFVYKKGLNDLLSKHTKQPLKVIDKDTDRDFFMSAEEALKYGIVDKIIEKR